jgi:hypothetical protein
MDVLIEILFFLQHVIVLGFVLCGIDFHGLIDFDLIGCWLCFDESGFVQ